jgi:hypothetical protein
MIVNIPPSLKSFCDVPDSGLTKGQQALLPSLLTAILLASGRRTQAALGRLVRRVRRHRSSISRLLRRLRFRTRDYFTHVFEAALEEMGLNRGPCQLDLRRVWVVAFDGVSTKRGGFTKIGNATKFKRKGKNTKGRSSKAHTFVMGVVITDEGARLPLPRRSFYTKDYCKKKKKKYLTQPALVALMLRGLKDRLPKDVALVVVADEYFEGQTLHQVCAELGFIYIVPVDSRRCFADCKGKSTGKRLHDRGIRLPGKAFKEVVLVRGWEETVSYRRYSRVPKRPRPEDTRRFRVYSEVRDVAKLGEVRVAYSWKNPVYRPRRNADRETYKVLVTNGLSLSDWEIVEYYDLRWQIELFFRELKSDLGLGDYRGTDFEAFERFVDLVLLAFLSQELRRIELLKKCRAPRKIAVIKGVRTRGMQALLGEESEIEDLRYFRECLRTEKGRRELLSLFPALRKETG